MTSSSPQLTLQQALELAQQHHQAGQLHQAETLYRHILSVEPNHPDALHLLGVVAMQVNQLPHAEDLIRRAIELNSGAAHYHNNLGSVLNQLSGPAEARKSFESAIALQPGFADAHYNLGNLQRAAGHLDQAVASYRRALELQPAHQNAQLNLGNALRAMRQFEESKQAFQTAVSMAPQSAVAHHNLALAFLLLGNYAEAWPHYEWRNHAPELGKLVESLPGPLWKGESLRSKTILLQTEQGFGDAIQFARFATVLNEMGARVTLRCHAELVRLFQTLRGVDQVVSLSDAVRDFDLHCPLMSVPFHLQTTIETLPRTIPYLNADPALIAKNELPDGNLKVGLAWRRRLAGDDSDRSVAGNLLDPFSELSGVGFYNLVPDKLLDEPNAPPEGFVLYDPPREPADFADTAALIAQLDIVISIDTAVAHLAAAMGKPTWVLVPYVPNWRWGIDGDRSPWYPNVELFRQPARGDWQTPIRRVIERLKQQ